MILSPCVLFDKVRLLSTAINASIIQIKSRVELCRDKGWKNVSRDNASRTLSLSLNGE